MKSMSVIVPGGLNTDIIGMGVDHLLKAGELTLGGKLKVGPGGKARNMAQMAAAYLGKVRVAMIGRTVKDPFGLWRVPYDALIASGVYTKHIRCLDFESSGHKFPGIALIPVDKDGHNQIYVLPGVNEDFSPRDIDSAAELLQPEEGQKVMVLALEIPLPTVAYAIDLAFQSHIPVVLDPGGMNEALHDILNEKIFLLKPNEHETKMLTGTHVRNFDDAQHAAQELLKTGIQNVMITHGSKGAYFFNKDTALHIPVPDIIRNDQDEQDETGCGDQVTAIVAAGLAEGLDVIKAARLAVKAGTLQFYRSGIQPVERENL
ncbi:MAG: hypothetical protein GF313_07435 [Caldithrix sp.]|nr:hypothetical protein [Caldithrix sp.]